jgi:hypothetical protein
MNLRHRVGPGIRSLESFREAMGVPRPASVSDMLSRGIALRFVGFLPMRPTSSPHMTSPTSHLGRCPRHRRKQTVQTWPPYEGVTPAIPFRMSSSLQRTAARCGRFSHSC